MLTSFVGPDAVLVVHTAAYTFNGVPLGGTDEGEGRSNLEHQQQQHLNDFVV